MRNINVYHGNVYHHQEKFCSNPDCTVQDITTQPGFRPGWTTCVRSFEGGCRPEKYCSNPDCTVQDITTQPDVHPRTQEEVEEDDATAEWAEGEWANTPQTDIGLEEMRSRRRSAGSWDTRH